MKNNKFLYRNLSELVMVHEPGTYKIKIIQAYKKPLVAKSGSLYYKVYTNAISYDKFKTLDYNLKSQGGTIDYNKVMNSYLVPAYIFEDNESFELFPLFRGDEIDGVIDLDESDDLYKCVFIKNVSDAIVLDHIGYESVTKLSESIRKFKTNTTNN